jgi:hypothetical protein
MAKHPLRLIAISAAVSLGAATPAAAGGCCPGVAQVCPCGPPIYVVNQGPVFTGPGPMIQQLPDRAPKAYPGGYPYVGFVFSGYPYGYDRPWVGDPAVTPVDFPALRGTVKRPLYLGPRPYAFR